MRVQLHTPRPELQPYIECIWVLESTPGGDLNFPRVPPFGEVELAFHLKEPFRYRGPDESPRRAPRAHVSGPRRRYFDLLPGRQAGFLSVRFRPGAFHYFQGDSLDRLTDRVIALEDMQGAKGREVLEKLHEAGATDQRLEIVQDYLTACLRERNNGRGFIGAAMQVLHRSLVVDGPAGIDYMAEELGLSRRSFQRKFTASFGLAPRDYRRLLRFEALVKDTLRRNALGVPPDLGEQALRYGYFDQAHFNRDFKEYMGLPPKEFLRMHGSSLAMII